MLSIVLVHIPAAAQRDGSYWNAHLAVLDMRTRVVGATAYVREIRLRNFQNPDSLPSAFGFAADLFPTMARALTNWRVMGCTLPGAVLRTNQPFPGFGRATAGCS
ncbi:MAG: hypothetical protein H6574_17445 [Lewinellaceae bacterium]|nr:hypothetical protein [Lewinellaceae bacterium]